MLSCPQKMNSCKPVHPDTFNCSFDEGAERFPTVFSSAMIFSDAHASSPSHVSKCFKIAPNNSYQNSTLHNQTPTEGKPVSQTKIIHLIAINLGLGVTQLCLYVRIISLLLYQPDTMEKLYILCL